MSVHAANTNCVNISVLHKWIAHSVLYRDHLFSPPSSIISRHLSTEHFCSWSIWFGTFLLPSSSSTISWHNNRVNQTQTSAHTIHCFSSHGIALYNPDSSIIIVWCRHCHIRCSQHFSFCSTSIQQNQLHQLHISMCWSAKHFPLLCALYNSTALLVLWSHRHSENPSSPENPSSLEEQYYWTTLFDPSVVGARHIYPDTSSTRHHFLSLVALFVSLWFLNTILFLLSTFIFISRTLALFLSNVIISGSQSQICTN